MTSKFLRGLFLNELILRFCSSVQDRFCFNLLLLDIKKQLPDLDMVLVIK